MRLVMFLLAAAVAAPAAARMQPANMVEGVALAQACNVREISQFAPRVAKMVGKLQGRQRESAERSKQGMPGLISQLRSRGALPQLCKRVEFEAPSVKPKFEKMLQSYGV